MALSAGCAGREAPGAAATAAVVAGTGGPAAADSGAVEVVTWWRETFEGSGLAWGSPSRHSAAQINSVYEVRREGPVAFLHARHDATGEQGSRGPAVHYGVALQPPPALQQVRSLRWSWRVTQHPSVQNDPWVDLGASVYVIVAHPMPLRPGRGFKFGWLARPGGPGESFQRGVAQVELRSEPAGPQWRHEQVDLCALYQKLYGRCEGERLQYVGVLTDADGTRSVAEADYASFELSVQR